MVRLSLALLFLFLTVLYIEHGAPLGGDGYYYFIDLRSMVIDHDLNLENDYARFGNPWRFKRVEATGRLPNWYAIGPAILWSPFYLVAHACAHVGHVFSDKVSIDGFHGLYQGVTFFGSLIYAFLALLAGFRLATRFVSRPVAAGAVWAVGLASPLFYFSLYATSYSHAASAFAVAIFFLYWVETLGREDWRRWLVLGLLCGFSALMRAQNGLFGIIPGIELLFFTIRSIRSKSVRGVGPPLAGAIMLAGGALVGFLPQLLVWRYFYGSMTGLMFHSWFMYWKHPFVWELLFSSHNGLFPWSPFLYLSVAGMVLLVRRHRMIGLAAILAFALQTYVNACAWPWSAGFSFGQRRFLALTIWFVVGSAIGLDRAIQTLRSRRIFRGVAVPLVAGVTALFCMLSVTMSIRVETHRLKVTRSFNMLDAYGEPARTLLAPLYSLIGNPFAFPAPLVYWAEYGLAPRYFDMVVGRYFAYRDSRDSLQTKDHISFGRADMKPFIRNMTPIRHGQRVIGVSVTKKGGRFFMPLYIPQTYTFVLKAVADSPDAGLRVLVNGTKVGDFHVGRSNTSLHFRAGPDLLRSGINTVDFLPQGHGVVLQSLDMKSVSLNQPGSFN